MNKLLIVLSLFFASSFANNPSCSDKNKSDARQQSSNSNDKVILTGADQLNKYIPLLMNKNVGLVVNHTSMIQKTHLVDTLLALNIKVKKIFAPEHGFRGKADAGEKVNNEVDSKTGLPIVSLYGNNKKPSKEQLQGLDILIFDIQDVGVRYFTYISTMHYLMEACAENKKELLILDRPNPNGFYIDGPVLHKEFKSFVGMHPIPVVHGLTIGELAKMINGEHWLDSGKTCKITVIPNQNYSHKDRYSLPIKPSPNLPNDHSIELYPSLGFFEGTTISVGRGTEFPFQVLGAPGKHYGPFSFTPVSIPGMAKNPPYENQVCNGIDLRKDNTTHGLTIQFIKDFYDKTLEKDKYFNGLFNKLAGTDQLRKQIIERVSEEKIRESWVEELNQYKAKRKKYLLYEDFE